MEEQESKVSVPLSEEGGKTIRAIVTLLTHMIAQLGPVGIHVVASRYGIGVISHEVYEETGMADYGPGAKRMPVLTLNGFAVHEMESRPEDRIYVCRWEKVLAWYDVGTGSYEPCWTKTLLHPIGSNLTH